MKWMFPRILGSATVALALLAVSVVMGAPSKTTPLAFSDPSQVSGATVLPAGPPAVAHRPASASLLAEFTPSIMTLACFCGAVLVVAKLLQPRLGHRRKRLAPQMHHPEPLDTATVALKPLPAVDEIRMQAVIEMPRDDFEMLVGEIYRRQGYQVELSAAAGIDGGIDLILRRGEDRVLVQCKARCASNVGAREIRDFYAMLISDGASRGVFVTTGGFTRDARDFAHGKPITMVDGDVLDRLMTSTEAAGESGDLLEVERWVPQFLAASRLTQPQCPFCRAPMSRRSGRVGVFWGCATYPRCCGRRKMRRQAENCEVVELGPEPALERAAC